MNDIFWVSSICIMLLRWCSSPPWDRPTKTYMFLVKDSPFDRISYLCNRLSITSQISPLISLMNILLKRMVKKSYNWIWIWKLLKFKFFFCGMKIDKILISKHWEPPRGWWVVERMKSWLPKGWWAVEQIKL